MDDATLLREYVINNSEAAFEALVSRYLHFVHSAAMRQVHDPQMAEEVAQVVFIILAKKAGRINDRTILSGWLFKTTRFVALTQTRATTRRRQYEQKLHMQSEDQFNTPDQPIWEQISPLLDEALAKLGEKDRQAVLLRFFQNKSLAEVGNAFGTGEDAARMRINRTLAKLNRYFNRHGISSTTAILAGVISANSVQATPVLLTKTITAGAVAKGATASASTLTLIKGALKVMAHAKLKTAALVGAALLVAGGSAVVISQVATPSRQSSSVLLKDFVAEKEAQATAAARAAGVELLPEYKALFAAARDGSWSRISKLWEELRQRAPQFGGNDRRLIGTQWETVKEVWGAYDNLEGGKVNYPVALASNVIESIPAGSIYFGGTDPGRFLITALQKSHTNADPFFTLTQNALADTSYLDYLQSFYGGKISIPTEEDSKRIYEDTKSRSTSPVTVPQINELLTRFIFDKNPNREFYVEENTPLDWMFPYLEPHGLIMKLNRQTRVRLSEDTIQADHDCWSKLLAPMIGDWLNEDTSVKDVCAFSERVYLQHNLSGFKGDSEFARNDWAQKWLSKLRISIAGLYVWRAGVSQLGRPAPAQNRPTSEMERQRLEQEADFAFRQCVALCPRSPEVAYYYSAFLMHQKRNADALLVAELALRFDPRNPQLEDILRRIPKAGN